MPARRTYDYSIIRIVPFVERQEFINAGVIVYCRSLEYLQALVDMELNRLNEWDPPADLGMIRSQLRAILTICEGKDPECALCKLSLSERFHWLTAPSSTIIQTSPVHSGICEDPEKALQKLYDLMVSITGKHSAGTS